MQPSVIFNYILQPAVGLLLVCALFMQCHQTPEAMIEIPVVGTPTAAPDLVGFAAGRDTSGYGELAQSDPIGFLQLCRERYSFRDYTCTFTKQERIGDKLTKPQEIAVRFREKPYSVDMEWVKNAEQAERALYVQDAWKDRKGRQLAWFKPAGVLLKLVVPRIKQPIAGRQAKAASRRSLDQFGFSRTLDLIIKYVEKGRRNNELEIHYVGESHIKGRPTYVFERFLPYDGREERYPDGLLRYHIDQEWLIPSACFSYADREGKELLGSYVLTDAIFDVGLDDDDFDPDKIDF